MVFEGVRGDGSYGDIAIDDVAIYDRLCGDVGTCNFEEVQSGLLIECFDYGLKYKNFEERRKSMGLMTLDQRRERGDLIEVYKILNGQTRIDPALFWEVREARNGARLVKSLTVNER